MHINIAELATSRYSTKAFDPEKQIPDELITQIYSLLRYGASSVNLQPWHFLVAQSAQAKARIAQSTVPGFAYNESKILNASHVVVFCARKDIDESHLQAILQQETADGRFANDEARSRQDSSRRSYVDLNRNAPGGIDAWIDKQIYLSLGSLLWGARALNIDACPMEGVDFKKLDAALELGTQNLRSVVVACLGYRSTADFNSTLPKSRLPQANVIRTL